MYPLRGQPFEDFVAEAEPRLRRAFAAAFGRDRGSDALSESFAWAWEHWDRVQAMENPLGYLYRVGASKTRQRKRPVFPRLAEANAPWIEPALVPALLALTEPQRVSVVLVHGFGWPQREVAKLLEIAPSTVQTHVERALAKLRRALEVTTDA